MHPVHEDMKLLSREYHRTSLTKIQLDPGNYLVPSANTRSNYYPDLCRHVMSQGYFALNKLAVILMELEDDMSWNWLPTHGTQN